MRLIDAIEAGKLTDDHDKAFIRSAATLNSVNKDTLHRHYNELYDRLKLYEDMYFEINERVENMLAVAGKKAAQKFIATPDAPVPVKLVTVTYAERRLKYFEQERSRAKRRYETAVHSLKGAKPHEPWHDDEISKAGEELQYYDDVVAMLKAEMEKQEETE